MSLINFHPKGLTVRGLLWTKSLIQALTTVRSEISGHQDTSAISGFAPVVEQGRYERVERIRSLMMGCLDPNLNSAHLRLSRRLHFASDVQALWYLRGDLMAVLSELTDERHARDQIKQITLLFEGLVPEGMLGRVAYAH
jgi:hypothetical protein